MQGTLYPLAYQIPKIGQFIHNMYNYNGLFSSPSKLEWIHCILLELSCLILQPFLNLIFSTFIFI